MFNIKKKPKSYPNLGLIPKKKHKPLSMLHRFANWLDNWHITRIMSSFGSLALILTLIVLWGDFEDRSLQRTNQAWSLLTTKASGNSGKRSAMEYLNKDIWPFKERTPLIGIDLSTGDKPGVYLQGVTLQNAELQKSILTKVDLKGANLTKAKLTFANLTGANLSNVILESATVTRANLTRVDLGLADLTNTNLAGSNLTGANLFGTYFNGTVLVGTVLIDTKFLTQESLGKACGDKSTKLPIGLKIRECKKSDYERLRAQGAMP